MAIRKYKTIRKKICRWIKYFYNNEIAFKIYIKSIERHKFVIYFKYKNIKFGSYFNYNQRYFIKQFIMNQIHFIENNIYNKYTIGGKYIIMNNNKLQYLKCNIKK